MRSIGQRLRRAVVTMGNRECERTTNRTTTPHSCTIRTATISKWCAVKARDAAAHRISLGAKKRDDLSEP